MEENFIRAFVKDPYFDKDQHNELEEEPICQERLYYNQQQDCYYCPMGQPMKRIGNRKFTSSYGYTQIYARYQAQNRKGCPLRGVCHNAFLNRIIEVNHHLRLFKEKARHYCLAKKV